jgi:hypothetical protein
LDIGSGFRGWVGLQKAARPPRMGISPGAKPGGEFAKIPRNQAFLFKPTNQLQRF